MKKIIIAALVLLPLAAAAAEKNMYFEFSLSYAAAISPQELEDNGTGVFDFAVPSAKAGMTFFGFTGIYAGTQFLLFVNRADAERHYSFLPLYGGISLSAPVDFFVTPAVYFEAGAAFSNERAKRNGFLTDYPWNGFYYNAGVALGFQVTSVLSLQVVFDRPVISGRDGGEIHVIRSGAGWKICM